MLPGHVRTPFAHIVRGRDGSTMIAVVGGLVAAAFFTAALLGSARSSRMIGAPSTLGGVMLVSSALAIPVALLTIDETFPPASAIPFLAIAGLGNVFGLLFEYIGLRSGKVGLVGSLAAAEGAVAAVLSVLAGEFLEPVQAAGVGLVAIGVMFAALARDPAPGPGAVPAAGAGSSRRALFFGALAGLSFGASLYATGRLGSDLALGWAILPPRIVGLTLIVLPLAATSRLRISRAALPFIAMSGTGEVGGFLAFAWGARDSIAVSSALAAQFASVAAIIAWVVLGERLTRLQWSGVAAVAVGVVLIALGAAA
jgi:drug/metabolite transporter (DMT)-like permease